MHADGRIALAVVAGVDGPLRQLLRDWNIPVHLLPGGADLSAPKSYDAFIREWAARATDLKIDLILANTLGEFAGIDVAQTLGIPSLWCIHESFPPHLFRETAWPGATMADPVFARFMALFHQATALVFEAKETSALFQPHAAVGNRFQLDYGIDLDEIRRFETEHSRTELRHLHGVNDDEVVFVVLGVFGERKAQSLIVNAFRSVPRSAKAKLFLVGAINSAYTENVRRMIADYGMGDRITVVPVVESYYEYLVIADVLLSASQIESLPRSMIEAMAFGRPILSTAVFGVNSLIDVGVDGWLVAPNNLKDLSNALKQVSTTPLSELARMGRNARAKIDGRHEGPSYGAKMAEAIVALVASRPEALNEIFIALEGSPEEPESQ